MYPFAFTCLPFDSLKERCAFAKNTAAMQSPKTSRMRCGRTAYPSLTGQRHCGWFSLSNLNEAAACDDAEHTRPVCAIKPG